MRLQIVALSALLAGCQNTPVNEALIEMAQRDAYLPDCPSLHVTQARQIRDLELPELVVQFAASRDCMTKWSNRLDSSEWRLERHGGWSSPNDEIFAGSFSHDSHRGIVVWWHANPISGVPDYTEEFSR